MANQGVVELHKILTRVSEEHQVTATLPTWHNQHSHDANPHLRILALDLNSPVLNPTGKKLDFLFCP